MFLIPIIPWRCSGLFIFVVICHSLVLSARQTVQIIPSLILKLRHPRMLNTRRWIVTWSTGARLAFHQSTPKMKSALDHLES
jgi:hypothetical protein